LAGAAVGAGVLAGRAEAEPDDRALTGGRFALELDGGKAGAPLRGGGGHVVGIVGAGDPTPTGAPKHITRVKYEDISLSCAAGMSEAFYEWIQHCFEGKPQQFSGRLTSRLSDDAVVDAVAFTDALISEVGFPALDAASKDAAEMTIKIRPGSSGRSKAGPRQTVSQRMWHAANFRLAIDGVDCSGVIEIEPFTVMQVFAASGVDNFLEPTTLEIADLKLTTTADHSKDFYDWHRSLVLQGKVDDKRAGTLTFLADDLKHALFTLTFSGLGIFLVDAQPPTARQRAARVGCHVWCDGVKLRTGTATGP
jgi:hypothetical protein